VVNEPTDGRPHVIPLGHPATVPVAAN
jgi:hypothetical protein